MTQYLIIPHSFLLLLTSSQVYLTKFNSILHMHKFLTKLSNKKIKFRSKPWITLGLPKSVSTKNDLLTKYMILKDVAMKGEAQTKYKQNRIYCLLY